jgi:hypothetical protein
LKTALCTISTKSHLFKSFTLLESVSEFSQTDLFCLITDSSETFEHSKFNFHWLKDLKSDSAEKLIKKYKDDELRWSLKPVYIKFLLEQGYDKVIYVDNDIFFYSSPDFLFDKLDQNRFLLTPHFYPANPQKNQNWLEANFRVGLYNAGFIGANKDAIPILEWWADCCYYNTKKAYWRGLYDDQKYLDLIPVIFENVEVIKHRGCNFAGWNCDVIDLKKDKEKLFIKNDELVFIHFAKLSMERFSTSDSIVHDAFRQYTESLQKEKPGFEFRIKKYTLSSFSTYFYYLRWRFSRLLE